MLIVVILYSYCNRLYNKYKKYLVLILSNLRTCKGTRSTGTSSYISV